MYKSGSETEADEYERNDEEGGRDGDTPRGALVEVVCVGGGDSPPRRKTRTSCILPLNMRTCCCRESMETSCITIIGFTWTEELQTTLSGSVVGAG